MAGQTNSSYGPTSERALEGGTGGDQQVVKVETNDPDGHYLQLSKDAWETSRDWFDASVRRKVEDNYNAFQNRHPAGSKYYSDSFKKRSALFRPRTRSAARKYQAAVATAFFSTSDVVACEAVDKSVRENVLSAQMKEAVLKHRLTQRGGLPWYTVCLGAFQDAFVAGSVISKQVWRYDEDEHGNVVMDQPGIDLLPIENFRIHPHCDWSDPINTSPYLIELQPITVADVILQTKLGENPKTGAPAWRKINEGTIRTAIRHQWDSVRTAREQDRTDRYEHDTAIGGFQTVWIHHHIMKMEDGVDYVWDTLGTEIMLSDPVPLWEYYQEDRRPYVMGSSEIEAHKPYPAAPVELSLPVQEEMNDLTNLQMDAIRLVTSPHQFVKRGAATDIHALVRRVPGGITFTNDPDRDIKEAQTPDVSRSAFEERDRLNSEFDDLMGVFMGNSVGVNRRLNETVGGMNLLSENSNMVMELTIRTFSETWVEPVLQQIMHLIEVYESDPSILNLISSQYSRDPDAVLTALSTETQVHVNVGFGNSNPVKRIEKLQLAMSTTLELMPQLQAEADPGALVTEIFGAAGYKDGSMFFPFLDKTKQEDPKVSQLQQQVQELTQMVETKQLDFESRERVAQIAADTRIQVEQIKISGADQMIKAKQRFDAWMEEQRQKMAVVEFQLEQAKEERAIRDLRMQREALSHSITMAERAWALQVYQVFGAPQGTEQPDSPSQGYIDSEADQAIPSGTRELVASLKNPPSGGPVNLPGNDKAGVLARGDYGMRPFAGG